MSTKVVIYGSFHPNVNGERFKICKSEKGYAGSNLVTDTLDFFKLLDGYRVAFRFLDFFKVDLA